MAPLDVRLIGVELYFEDLSRAEQFYRDKLGLKLSRRESGRYAQFGNGAPFLCLEKKGTESYPSRDKAVVFLEVPDLQMALEALGRENMVHVETDAKGLEPRWAVLHDPEGHNVVLLEKEGGAAAQKP